MRNVAGCDSIRYVFDLTVQFAFEEESRIGVCEDELPYTWRGYVIAQPGTYFDTTRYLSTGCDSMQYTLTLDVDYRVEEDYMTKCIGDGVVIHGLPYSTTGFYQNTLLDSRGCDSLTWSVDLTVNTPYDLIPAYKILCSVFVPLKK